MVYVPSRPDSDTAPTTAREVELQINRRNTRYFIDQDPTDLVLKRPQNAKSATGARVRATSIAIPEQRFKLIMVSPAGGSLDQSSEDGRMVRADYVLIGEHDADIEAGDFWYDDFGQQWVVYSLIPYNGYETRANVSARGQHLEGG